MYLDDVTDFAAGVHGVLDQLAGDPYFAPPPIGVHGADVLENLLADTAAVEKTESYWLLL
jgi:hypothetical protein